MDYSQLPLQPYHLPEPVSWWPPALGWIILAAAVLLGITLITLLFFRWRAQGWRRAAHRELDALHTAYRQGNCSNHELAGQLSILLRRICLTRFPNEEALAGCTGETWQHNLERLCRGKVTFNAGKGKELLQAAYNAESNVDESHIALCRKWLKALPARPLFSFGFRSRTTRRKVHV